MNVPNTLEISVTVEPLTERVGPLGVGEPTPVSVSDNPLSFASGETDCATAVRAETESVVPTGSTLMVTRAPVSERVPLTSMQAYRKVSVPLKPLAGV